MSSDIPITLDTVIARNDEPVAVEVDRTVVMMSVEQGMYYGLEGAGPRIWALLEQPRTVGQVCDELSDEFDVDAEICRREVRDFLEELRRAGLVRVHDQAADPIRPPAGS
ncbi:MAG: PqqD family peptide modification chaperone [Gemmatimonadota bacterium]